MEVTSEHDVANAEKTSRRRAALALIMPVLLLQQVAFAFGEHGTRTVDMVRLAGWVMLAIVLLVLLVTGGMPFRSAKVRALMNDEVTLQNRAKAIRLAFALTMAMAIGCFAVEGVRPGTLATLDVLHLIVSIGLAGGLLCFGVLERRSLG